MPRQTVIFCDFDGTITEQDNIIAIMRHFNPPGWEETTTKILNRQISIKDGVSALFALLPSAKKADIINYAIDNITIRKGFADFVQFCRERRIKLIITSGGIDFFIYPILKRYGIQNDIYCNNRDFQDEHIRIIWPHPCGPECDNHCGMCKPTIVRSFDSKSYHKVLIGDSITDLAAAKLVDFVYAREFLLNKCRELNLKHHPFNTFHDVIEHLKQT